MKLAVLPFYPFYGKDLTWGLRRKSHIGALIVHKEAELAHVLLLNINLHHLGGPCSTLKYRKSMIIKL